MMYSSTTSSIMKLKQTAAQELLDKVLDRSTPVLESGTPEEIHHITSAIKDILEVMATEKGEGNDQNRDSSQAEGDNS